MIIRILAVEDKDVHFKNLKNAVLGISDKDRRAWRIDEFEFSRATTKTEAIGFLKAAEKEQKPYDMMILDLSIPESANSNADLIKHGFNVLAEAQKIQAAKQIVIFTGFPGDDNVLQALQAGATDFIKKLDMGLVDEKVFHNRFLACWRRILENDGAYLMEERIKNLVPYAEAGLADRFTNTFTSFLQKVAHTAEDVEHYASERFGLDPVKDSQDYLIRSLKNQEDEIKSIKNHWSDLKADLIDEEMPQTGKEPLSELLEHMEQKWSPCFAVKNCTFENNCSNKQVGLMTFNDDVRVIVQEIIAGTLSTLSDYGPERSLKTSARVGDGQVEIQFLDDLDEPEQKLSPIDCQIINNNLIVSPNHGPKRFGRAWGLSVAQYLALRGGGRLIAMPQQVGNSITYCAPLSPSKSGDGTGEASSVTPQ